MKTTQQLRSSLTFDNWLLLTFNILGLIFLLITGSIILFFSFLWEAEQKALFPLLIALNLLFPILAIICISINLSNLSKKLPLLIWPYYVMILGYAYNIIASSKIVTIQFWFSIGLTIYSIFITYKTSQYNRQLKEETELPSLNEIESN